MADCRPAADLSGAFRLGWDERGLLVLVTVRDDAATEGKNPNELWQKDSLELFFGVRRGVRDWVQALVGPAWTRRRRTSAPTSTTTAKPPR
jgi:hypothetical protein